MDLTMAILRSSFRFEHLSLGSRHRGRSEAPGRGPARPAGPLTSGGFGDPGGVQGRPGRPFRHSERRFGAAGNAGTSAQLALRENFGRVPLLQ